MSTRLSSLFTFIVSEPNDSRIPHNYLAIMAPAAGELISELTVAKDAKLPFDKLSTVMHSYPSYSIALQQMGADVYYEKLKKSKVLYDILKMIGL